MWSSCTTACWQLPLPLMARLGTRRWATSHEQLLWAACSGHPCCLPAALPHNLPCCPSRWRSPWQRWRLSSSLLRAVAMPTAAPSSLGSRWAEQHCQHLIAVCSRLNMGVAARSPAQQLARSHGMCRLGKFSFTGEPGCPWPLPRCGATKRSSRRCCWPGRPAARPRAGTRRPPLSTPFGRHSTSHLPSTSQLCG